MSCVPHAPALLACLRSVSSPGNTDLQRSGSDSDVDAGYVAEAVSVEFNQVRGIEPCLELSPPGHRQAREYPALVQACAG